MFTAFVGQFAECWLSHFSNVTTLVAMQLGVCCCVCLSMVRAIADEACVLSACRHDIV